MENQLTIAIMRKHLWFLVIVLAVLLPKIRCRHYKNNIGLATLPRTRQYVPKYEDDSGGWIIRIVTHEGNFACGGAYIAPLIVVSSANCMFPYSDAMSGLIAETDKMLDLEDNFSFIDTFYAPPDFKDGENHMDVAVLRLRSPIKGKTTEFIKLCSTPIEEGMDFKSFGWGYGSFTILTLSSTAMMRPVPSISKAKCKRKWHERPELVASDSLFCVQFDKANRTKCLYDPGSPLVYKNQFCGIVSEGTSCLHSHVPAIYTDVNKVRDFILLTMAQIQMGFRLADLEDL